jgi:hypothetical protein
MKTRTVILLLLLTIILPNISKGQGWILRRAIDRKIEHKVDSAVDKSDRDEAKARQQASKNDTASTTSTQKTGTKETGRGLFGGKIDIKYNDEYKFTGRIYMQMETYDKKDVMKADCYTYFNENSLDAAIEMLPVQATDDKKSVPTIFVFDNTNRAFMMLLVGEGSKTGMISTIPSDSAMAAQTKKGTNPEKAVVTKTGNTRVIAGYKCDEYKITEPDKDGYSNVWMTKDVKIKADKKYWGKAGVPNYYGYPGFEGAVMLAMEGFDKKNNPTMKMETKEISDKYSHSVSTTGYTFMKMNFGQSGKK